MASLINLLGINMLGFFLILLYEGSVSSGVYDIKKSLTPLGWALVIIIPIAVIFGTIYLIAKILKKPKSKLK